MSAVAHYAALVDAAAAQRDRFQGGPRAGDRWGGALARRFRVDPRRALDPNLEAVASYVRPDDVVVDVGGGAGRLALPLALRCREVINVDPSPGMGAEFADLAAESGITNARFVQQDWLTADDVEGDIALTANVTYFVRDIVPFLRRMERAARRRVMITVWSVPPPAQNGGLFRLVYGVEQIPPPSYRHLLPALWEMGALPDVRVLPGTFRDGPPPATRDEAVAWAMLRLGSEDPGVRATVESRFHELFAATEGGFQPRWRPDARELLITWEPAGA